ncbi:MAG TPA: M3 family metallopeptidase [Acidimicrobiia bacterium]|nr:M3 family metallopeptidase [Acidimicrobiia bacterium]
MFDYTRVTVSGINETLEGALSEADLLVAGVVDPGTDSTYDKILSPLNDVEDLLVRTYGQTAFMGYVHQDKEVRDAGNAAEERIQKWAVDLIFRPDFYRAIKTYSESPDAARLTGERRRMLDFLLRDLRKAGHELDEGSRAEVKKLTERLVELGVLFQRNIDEHQDHLTVTREDLEGMPESYIEGLEPGDAEGTFKVTMSYPDVVPFMENSPRRDLRQALSAKFNSRAVEPNRPLLEEAMEARQRIAELFAQPSWAHHQLEEKMAKYPEAVRSFYAALLPGLTEIGQTELGKLTEMLRADGADGELQSYDFRYYDTQLRRRDYGVDPTEVAAHFPLHQVIDGMLELTGEVFGLRYRKIDRPAWHQDVLTYAIDDAATGEEIAQFFMDLFPREGKFSHAAAFPLVPGRRLADGSYQKPLAAIVANFTKPGADRPSLLQHQEVETFFHEFGHILHQTLTKAELTKFSGTSTEGDFVEAPSQIMENWTWQSEVLARFARHYETGEPISPRLVSQLTAAKNLNIALLTLRQAQFGLLDLWMHDETPQKDLDDIHVRSTQVSLFPIHADTFYPASFGHLLGGYDAGYYGYLWSEVYGDDMWSRFEKEGVVNPAVGADYRHEVLEMGGSRDGIEHLRAFLGREPNNEAFLRKLGMGTEPSI